MKLQTASIISLSILFSMISIGTATTETGDQLIPEHLYDYGNGQAWAYMGQWDTTHSDPNVGTIRYYVNPTGVHGMNNAPVDYIQTCQAMIQGVKTWDDAVAQNLLVINQTPCSYTIQPDLFTPDGITAIGFADLNSAPYSCNGCAALTSRTSKPANYPPYEIIEVDILLNTGLPWGIAPDTCTYGSMSCYYLDVQSVVVHEFAHGLGLRDIWAVAGESKPSQASNYFNLTMYGFVSPTDTRERTLEYGDIQGIKSLYEYGWVSKYAPPVVSPNVIKNPTFTNSSSWLFYTNGKGTFTTPGYANIAIITAGTNVQLQQTKLKLESNTKYRLSFDAKSSSGHDLKVSLIKQTTPYNNYGLGKVFNVGTSMQTFTTEFITTGFTGTALDGRLMFALSPYATAGDLYTLDNVVLEKVSGTPALDPDAELKNALTDLINKYGLQKIISALSAWF